MQGKDSTKQPEQAPVEVKPDAVSSGANPEIDASLVGSRDEPIGGRKFGSFNGVIRPTILTILGVMMYLREGWVVGNAGLGGAILIILMCYFITGTTALSLSSITTNIRLGAGGVFTLITQSLGLEVGGSIGIPFYLAQGMSVAMYIYGFMEGWVHIFPNHSPLLVVIAVFAVVFALSYISTTLAFRVQIFVMIGVILALGSIFLGLYSAPVLQNPTFFGDFENANYWILFAVFFPASTGIMVGASMSGNLTDPRKSIPAGTMTAWGLSLLIYLVLAIWYSLVATPEELRGNLTIAIDKAYWGPAVLIGILSSCFTAALSSFIASPRTLQSLGKQKILPFPEFFGKLHNDEPRNAILVTGGMVLIILLLGDLNAIAQIVTVFFLMTYFIVNFILLIEKKLNLISFRPTFRIPILVPFLGSLSCLTAIVVVSPLLGLTCVLLSITIYIYLDRRALEAPYETLNSGLFISIANWAARKIALDAKANHLRSWKPDILYPVERTTQLQGYYRLLLSLARPQGSVQAIGVKTKKHSRLLRGLENVIRDIRMDGIYASSAIIESPDFLSSLRTAVSVMKSPFFEPNILFSPINDRSREELQGMLEIAGENQLGVVFLARHPDTGLGRGRQMNIWIREQSPNWQLSFSMANIDLPLLLALMLIKNWDIRLRLITLVTDPAEIDNARLYLKNLMALARIPKGYSIVAESADFREYIDGDAPHADLNLFGLTNQIDKKVMEELVKETESTCLFVKDSGLESVLM